MRLLFLMRKVLFAFYGAKATWFSLMMIRFRLQLLSRIAF